MFGRAVAERAVVVTHDYPDDPSFRHAARTGPRSSPTSASARWSSPRCVAGDEVFGAIGTFSTRAGRVRCRRRSPWSARWPTMPPPPWPTRASSRSSTARAPSSPNAPRSSGRCARSTSASRPPSDLSDVLQRAIDEAARLLHADGARIDLIDAGSGLLRWAYAVGGAQARRRRSGPTIPTRPSTRA